MCSTCCSSDDSERVPIWKKLSYGVGALPYTMTQTVLGFFFSIFLLEVVILDPVYVLIILFTGRVWEAVSDPVVGYLLSLTKTRFGRLRPWMVVAMVPLAVAYFMLWYVPPLDQHPQHVKFIYYLIFYYALLSLLASLYVPFSALTLHMSDNGKERDSVTFYRICLELTGVVVAVAIYVVFYVALVQFSSSSSSGCDASSKRVPNPQLRAVYRWQALTIALLIMVFISITVLSVREQREEMDRNKAVGFVVGLKETFGFRPFFCLFMLNILSWMGVQFLHVNAVLYLKYSVGLEKQYPYVIAVFIVSTVLWTFFWQFILARFGKKSALFVGSLILLPFLVVTLYLNYFPPAVYITVVIQAIGVSCVYLVVWSMLPDVIDESLLRSGVRREELFTAFFVFGSKLAVGVPLGVSIAVYKIAGYNENSCEQPWTVPLALKLLISVPSSLLILISLIFLHLYPITEKSRENTKRLLARKRLQVEEEELSLDVAHSAGGDAELPLLNQETTLPKSDSELQ